MRYHLRLTGSTTGEIHQHDIVIGIRLYRLYKRGSISDTFLKILKAFRHTRANAYHMLQGRTTWKCFNDMIGYHILTGTNNHLDIGSIATIDDVLLSQQVSSWNHHRTKLMQSNNTKPEFDTTLQNKHHHISLTDTQTLEIRCCSIGLFFQFGKCILMFGSLIVCPKNRLLVRLFGCPSIYHIVAEVKVFRNLYLQVLYKVLLRGKFSLFYKSFQHNTFSPLLHDNCQELYSLTIQSLHTMRFG